MTLPELIDEGRRLSEQLDQALRDHAVAVVDAANTEVAFKRAWAQAYTSASGPVKEREAHADLASIDQREAWKISEGLLKSAALSVRSRQQQLSFCQSAMAAHREEAQFTRTRHDG